MDTVQDTTEIWKPIPGYEGAYEVSNLGRVRTTPRLLSLSLNRGYVTASLRKAGKTKSFLVHRLILQAFIGPAPEGMEGCHNDGKRGHNHLDNLRWDTKQNNAADRVKHGRGSQGSQNGKAKLQESDIASVELLLKQGVFQKDIAPLFNVVQTTISTINQGKHWSQNTQTPSMFPLSPNKKDDGQNLPHLKGGTHPGAKTIDTERICALHAQGLPQHAIAALVGTSQMMVSRILRGAHWSQRS